MATTHRTSSFTAPPRTLRRAGRDALAVLAAFALCPLVAVLAPDDPAGPIASGHRLVALERSLGVLVEPDLIAWGQRHPGVLLTALLFYLSVHVPATVGAMVWCWLERPHAFRAVRNAFLATQAIVVCGYLLLPVAPPRFVLPGAPSGPSAEGIASLVQSPYAAMPSGHVAFAVFAAAVVLRLTRSRLLHALAVAYPVLVSLVILVTAHHYVLDIAGGAAAAAAGLALGKASMMVRAPRRARVAAGLRRPRAIADPAAR